MDNQQWDKSQGSMPDGGLAEGCLGVTFAIALIGLFVLWSMWPVLKRIWS